ncbi:MAG: flavodoxin [Clostridia bacterium]|nr:flavodoxin [Clostridia bacterium]
MANSAVLFKSHYGATSLYAQHIAQSLGADLYDLGKDKKIDFEKYDTLIYGGGIYAGSINGLKKLKKHAEKLEGKSLVVFSVGLGDPTVASEARTIINSVNKALPKELMAHTHIFNFRGSLEWNKMSFMHRTMMKMVNNILKKKKAEDLSDSERDTLNNFGKDIDHTNLASAAPLIDYVLSLN